MVVPVPGPRLAHVLSIMSTELPGTVEALVETRDQASRDAAWSAFLAEFGDLILHVARTMGGDHDACMDRYAFVLDRLRTDDFARLRRYAADGRGKFSTWLVVVIRRLCLDEHRRRYGRMRGADAEIARAKRRQLEDLVAAEIDVDQVRSEAVGADSRLERLQASAALAEGLAELEPADRLLLRLRFEDGLSVPEAARVLGLPSPFHGYRRLSAILARLRDHLLEAGIEDSGG
jgi:RNA polymerase sigma factor (sigma-70 family)